MDYTTILPVLISFAISAALGPVVIPLLRRLKFGQTERDDGPKSHLKKTGTPTMGGLMILAGIIITSLFYVKDYPKIIPILFVTAGFGIIGFLDDYIKIMLRRSEGLTPGQKMLGQFLVTGIFVFYYYNLKGGDMAMLIPFMPGHYLHLGWLAVPVAFLAIIGTVNGANFTDGLDGLASSVTVLIATFFSVVAIGTQSGSKRLPEFRSSDNQAAVHITGAYARTGNKSTLDVVQNNGTVTTAIISLRNNTLNLLTTQTLMAVLLDENGQPTKWKIENSWSDEHGNKGYYLMNADWFDQFVYQAVINKKYLSEEQLKEAAQEPTHLSPWDPMGTLAD